MFDFSTINPCVQKALFIAKNQLPELVCDAVNLEGIYYTLSEVKTLLQGIAVAGHSHSDEKITLNQAAAWQQLFQWLQNQEFALTKARACELHAIAAVEEALEWGSFRSGAVTIAGSDYQPPKATELPDLWEAMVAKSKTIDNIYERSIYVFLQMARNQFFYDVNKRMGRFMMNGLLIAAGYPAINLPAAKQTAFMLDCLDPRLIEIMSESH